MSESPSTVEFFQILSKVLLRCWIIGLSLGLMAYAMYRLEGSYVYQMHDKMFGMTRHELDLIFCCGMGFLKLFVVVFFLIPWLAIRMVIEKPAEPA